MSESPLTWAGQLLLSSSPPHQSPYDQKDPHHCKRDSLSLTSLKSLKVTHLLSVTMGVEIEVIAGLPLVELAGLWVELSVDISLPVEPFICCILRFLLDNRLKIEFKRRSLTVGKTRLLWGAL